MTQPKIQVTDAKILGYANFISTETQTAIPNTPTAIRMEVTPIKHPSITLVDQTKIYISNDGPYNLQFSFQIQSSTNSEHHIDVWIRYNGQDYPWTNTRMSVTKGMNVAAWNIFGEAVGGGYVELIWLASDSDISIVAVPPNDHPGIPSVIVTLNRLNEV